MAYSPDALRKCFDTVKARMPSAQLGGIYTNKPGYHNARANLPSSDYSVQKPPDKEGDAQAGGALDITFGSLADQKNASKRLLDAKNDPRCDVLREFFGSTDGVTVCGWDYYGGYAVTSDNSHLWHVHVSGLRKHLNDGPAWQAVADVITGTGSGGGGASEGDEDMPKRFQAKRIDPLRVNKINVVWDIKWDQQDWDTGNIFYGTNAPEGDQKGAYIATGKPDGASYVSTFNCKVAGLTEGQEFLTGISYYLLSTGETTGGAAWKEWRAGPGGKLEVVDTRVGYSNPGKGIAIRVQTQAACDIEQAVWAVIHWPQ